MKNKLLQASPAGKMALLQCQILQAPPGLTLGLPITSSEPHLDTLGEERFSRTAVTKQTEAVEWANINPMKGKNMTKHLLYEKYGGGKNREAMPRTDIWKNTFF